MAPSSKLRHGVSTLLPIAEHRRAKVCDSSFLDDEATFGSPAVAVAGGAASAPGKSSSGYGKKVVRPLVNLKKAFAEMLVSEPRSHGRTVTYYGNSSDNDPAHWPAFSVGMGMVPMAHV